MRRRVWLGLVALAAVFSLFLGVALPGRAAEAKFKDSPADSHWAGQSLGTLAENQMLLGYPDGTYRGDQAATRYELAAALSRLYALIQKAQQTADAQHQAALAQSAADVQALQKSLGELEQRVTKAEQAQATQPAPARKEELAAVDKAVEELAAQADATSREVKKLARQMLDLASQAEVQGLRAQLQEVLRVGDDVRRLGDRLAGQEQAIGRLDGRVNQLAADLAAQKTAADARNSELQLAIAQLRRQLNDRATTGDLDQVKERLASLEASLASLSVAAAAADRDRSEAQQTMKELGSHVEQVASDLGALGNALEALRAQFAAQSGAGPAELSQLEERLAALEKSLASASAAVAEADKDRTLAQVAVKELSDRVNQLAAELAAFGTASADLRRQIAAHPHQADPELGLLKERQAALEASVAKVSETAAAADKEQSVVQAAVDQLGGQVARIAADLAALTTTSEELRRQLTDHLATGAGDLAQVKEHLAALEATVADVAAVAAEANKGRAQVEAAMEQLGGKVEQVAADLAALRTASEARLAELKAASDARFAELTAAIAELRRQVGERPASGAIGQPGTASVVKDAELQAALDELRRELAGHLTAGDTELNQVKARLAALEAALAGVSATADAAAKDRSEAQQAMRSLGGQVEAIAADLASLKATSEGLRRELANRPASDESVVGQLKERLVALESALASVAATAAAADKERNTAQQAMENLSGQVNRIAADLAELKTATDDLRRRLGAIPDDGRAGLNQVKERLTALENALAGVTATAAAADQGRQAVQAAMKDLADQVNRVAAELAALKVASEELRRQLAERPALDGEELDQLKQRLAVLEASLANASATADAADRARLAAQEAMAKLAEQVNELAARLAQQDKDRLAAQEELWTVTKELGGKVERVQDRLGDLAQTEENVRQLAERLGAVETQMSAAAADAAKADALKLEVDGLEQQLSAVRADFAKQFEALQLADRDRVAAQEELWLTLKELGGKLEQLRKAQEAAGAQVDRTASDLAEHKEVSDAWKQQLESGQTELGGRLDQAVTGLTASDEALRAADQQLQQCDQELAAQDQELQKADQALAGQLTDLERSTAAQVADLRKAGEGLDKRVVTLESKAEEQAKETISLKGGLQETRQSVDDLRVRVAALEEETNKLKTNFRRLTWLIALGAVAVAAF